MFRPAFWRVVWGVLTVMFVLVSEFAGWPWPAPEVQQSHAAGIQVSSRSDTLSDPLPSATSNHTFSLTTNTAVTASSTATLTFPAGFTIPGALDCGDVDAATGTQFAFNYPGCLATATAWGFSAAGSIATLTAPTAGGATSTDWGSSGMVTYSSGASADYVRAIAIDSSRNIYVAGYQATNANDWAVRKYDASGALVTGWGSSGMVTYDSGSGDDEATAITIDGANNIYVAGFQHTNVYDWAVRKYDANGALVTSWGTNGMVTYDSGFDQAYAIAIDSDRNIYVGGIVGTNGGDWAVRKYTDTYVKSGTPMTIKIGSNATSQQQGAHWITNPSTAGVYTISVGGTFGGSGNIPVSINAGVTVAATVAESLAFSINPVQIIRFVQSQTGANFPAGSVTATFTNPTATGNLIVVAVRFAATNDVSSVTDNQGNTFNPVQAQSCSPTNGRCFRVFYAKNISGGASHAITANMSLGSDNLRIAIHEYAGADTANPLDQFTASTNTGTACDSGSVNTTQANELLFGVCSGFGEFFAAGDMYTVRANLFNSPPFSGGITEDRFVYATGAYSATSALNGGSDWAGQIATFKGASPQSCIADDGASVSQISATSNSVPFGNISPNIFYQGCQDLSVSTNAGGGYSVAVQENHAMMTSNGLKTIPDTTCDAGCSSASSGAWVTAMKNGLGHTCTNQLGHDCAGAYSSGTKFRPFANVASGSNGITLVQSTSGSNTGNVVLAFPSNNLPGDLIVVGVGLDNGQTASVTDSSGNTYQTAIGPTDDAGFFQRGYIFYAANIKAGGNTITVSHTSGNITYVAIHEYSGLSRTSPLDQTAGVANDATTNFSSGNTGSTAQANELLFGWGHTFEGVSWAAGSGYTGREQATTFFSEDQIISAVGPYAATATVNISAHGVMQIATFKASSDLAEVIMSSSTPAIATGRVKYRLSVPTSQAPGTYTNTIVYTITATY